MSQFLRISRLTVPVLTPITSPISLRLIGLCSNLSIVNRCSLVKCLYPILCRFSGYDSKVILSGFKALHFRVESSSIFSIINALHLQRGSLTRRKRIIHLVCVAEGKPRFRAETRGRRKPSGAFICVARYWTAHGCLFVIFRIFALHFDCGGDTRR